MNIGLRAVGFLSLLWSLSAWAVDPVSWSLSPASGFPATKVGDQSIVQYTFTNRLPTARTLLIDSNITGGNFSVYNECYNKSLPLGASCSVVVAFNPAAEKQSAFQLIYGYDNNRISLPILAARGLGESSEVQLTGTIDGLPPAIYKGSTVEYKAIYTNKGASTLSGCTYPNFTHTGISATLETSFGTPPCVDSILPGSSCQMDGSVVSNSTGSLTIYGHASCAQAQAQPKASTGVLNKSGCVISASVPLPLPVKTYQYAKSVVKFEFINHCPRTQTLGRVVLKADAKATLIKGSDTCSGKNLNSKGLCSVLVSVMPNAVTPDLTVSAILPYKNNTIIVSAHTSEQVQAIPNQATKHTVTFVNQCNYPVWYEFSNGNGSATYPSSPDPTPANKRTMNDYKLNGQVAGRAPAIKVLSVTEYLNGALYARTGCNPNTGVCETSNCEVIPHTGTCKVGVQPNPPQTKFELNMTASGFDGIYDVSLINGFNVPGEIQSLAPVFSGPTPTGNIPFPFNCGQSAGGLIQPANGLGACSWSLIPPSTAPDTPANYQWVAGDIGGANCTTNADCNGEYCGMTSPLNGKIYRRCGAFLGYWTLADYIGYYKTTQWENGFDLYTLYAMATKLTPIGTGSTDYGTFKAGSPPASISANNAAMYGCIPTTTNALNTGYNTQTKNNDKVCGCYNWDQAGAAKTAQVTPCTGFNTQWKSTVFPRILWLKRACPTAYSYQFDDKSSQFQCNRPAIRTSYQITFCAGGKTGKPA